MKIIFDGTIYSMAPSGGVYRYFNEIIPRVSRFPKTEVKIFTPKDPVGMPEGIDISLVKDRLPSGSWIPEGKLKQFLRSKKQNVQRLMLKRKFSGIRDSVFHSTYYTLSPWASIPQVVTIHDMISELFQETYDLPHVKALREAKLQCLEKATRVIAISERTKKDLQSIYRIPENRIDVIYHGVDYAFFSDRTAKEAESQFLKENSLLSPFFLYLGGRLHHKNFKKFLMAFAESTVSNDFKLLVAGSPWEPEEKELIKKLGMSEKVIWMPNLNEEELRMVYQNAKALALPSYYEGFGLPLIEAMAAGCPVIASESGPFPELAAGAALLFNPFDEAQMAQALEDIIHEERREHLVKMGKIQALKFDWEKSANQHLESYKKALEQF